MMAELTELRTRLKAVEQERNDFKLKFERLEVCNDVSVRIDCCLQGAFFYVAIDKIL